MFYDDAGRRFRERLDAFQRGIRIRHVVVGQFLTLYLPRRRHRYIRRIVLDKKCRTLVGIFAITHGLHLPVLEVNGAREICPFSG